MYKVERAIIMAAGKGTRMRPITLHTPKPLVKVNGKRMIDSVIEALHKNGISEIYIVVGYLKDQFEILPKEYENVKLIENPFYDTCNNISSLYVARDYIEKPLYWMETRSFTMRKFWPRNLIDPDTMQFGQMTRQRNG